MLAPSPVTANFPPYFPKLTRVSTPRASASERLSAESLNPILVCMTTTNKAAIEFRKAECRWCKTTSGGPLCSMRVCDRCWRERAERNPVNVGAVVVF